MFSFKKYMWILRDVLINLDFYKNKLIYQNIFCYFHMGVEGIKRFFKSGNRRKTPTGQLGHIYSVTVKQMMATLKLSKGLTSSLKFRTIVEILCKQHPSIKEIVNKLKFGFMWYLSLACNILIKVSIIFNQCLSF